MKNSDHTYSGECLCGKTRYSIVSSSPHVMFFCHCSRCRKETGTVHGANIFLENAELSWERGEDQVGFFNLPGTRHSRAFCKICASPLPRREGKKALVLPAGTLDNGENIAPTAHIFCEDRASWEDQLAELPRFDKLPY